ncbi:MAG: acyl carrier protein [Burkholderiales bacterium]
MSTLTRDQIREAIFEVLEAIAPEIDRAQIVADESVREQVDLDSFDFLNVIIGVHERLGVEIPEADYGQLGTLDSMVDYLMRRSADAETAR